MNYKSLFSPGDCIYLNSGTMSRVPLTVFNAMQQKQRDFEVNPTRKLFESFPALWEVQGKVANFFGATPQEFFFRPNVTLALNTFFFSYPWEMGEILYGSYEYGACINIAKVAAEKAGLTTRKIMLPSAVTATEDSLVEAVVSSFTPSTRGLLLSHVCTGNGLILPIRRIAAETRKRGIAFVVDGAHAAGAIPVDFRELADLDFYGSNLHKWMMGPKGTGFGWLAKRHHGRFALNHGGWASFSQPDFYQNFGDRDPFVSNLLNPGCFDVAPFLALSDLVDFWNSQGPETIRARIRELQNFTEDEIDRVLGWEKLSPPRGPLRGPLLTYRLPEGAWRKRGEYLIHDLPREIGVQIHISKVNDEPVMRFSPHIYLEQDEIKEGIRRLSEYRPA